MHVHKCLVPQPHYTDFSLAPKTLSRPSQEQRVLGAGEAKLIVINLCIYLSYCFRRNSSFVRTPKDTRYVAAHGRIM